MKSYILMPIFLVGFLYCTREPVDKTIRPLQTSSSSFTAKVSHSVVLSPIDGVALDWIYMFELHADRFYLFDLRGKFVLIYNKNGTFVNKVNSGNGLGELLHPQGFSFAKDTLIVSEANALKYYSLSGKFLEEKKLPKGLFASCVTPLPNGNWLTYGMSPDISKEIQEDYLTNQFYYFHMLDPTLSKEILPLVPLSMECGGMETGKAFHFYKDHYLLSEGVGNHLVVFDGKRVTGTYTIDFEEFTFRDEELRNNKIDFTDLIFKGERYGLIDMVNETRNLLTLRYLRKGKEKPPQWSNFKIEGAFTPTIKVTVLYSKRTGKTADFSEVLKSSGIPEMALMNTTGNEFLCLFEPSDFSEEKIQDFKNQGLISNTVTNKSFPIVFFIKITENKD